MTTGCSILLGTYLHLCSSTSLLHQEVVVLYLIIMRYTQHHFFFILWFQKIKPRLLKDFSPHGGKCQVSMLAGMWRNCMNIKKQFNCSYKLISCKYLMSELFVLAQIILAQLISQNPVKQILCVACFAYLQIVLQREQIVFILGRKWSKSP